MNKDLVRKSKKLSWLLRHGANEAGVEIDASGWVKVSDALRVTSISRDDLDTVIEENNKKRFELDEHGTRIRARQGHSLDIDLEKDWTVFEGTESIWHGTHLGALQTIAREGLKPMTRTHVHLAEKTDSVVGKRANVDVLLEVDPEVVRKTNPIYQSANGVLLAKVVPPEAITGLRAQTRRAREQEAHLKGLFSV